VEEFIEAELGATLNSHLNRCLRGNWEEEVEREEEIDEGRRKKSTKRQFWKMLQKQFGNISDDSF
jgi:hypothetical protein